MSLRLGWIIEGVPTQEHNDPEPKKQSSIHLERTDSSTRESQRRNMPELTGQQGPSGSDTLVVVPVGILDGQGTETRSVVSDCNHPATGQISPKLADQDVTSATYGQFSHTHTITLQSYCRKSKKRGLFSGILPACYTHPRH